MSTADVKVDVVATGAGVPKHAKLAQILSILVSGVIALAVSSVLADGQSVIILKPVKDLPPATNPALKDLVSHKTVNKYGEFTDKYVQLKWNLAELLGPGYGVGLHHDQSGHIWNEAGAEDQDLAFLIKDLGIDAVMAAVPSVISTDGLKHPVHFLGCKNLERSGLAAMSFGFIAEIVAVVMVIFHSLMLAGMLNAKLGKAFSVLVWTVLVVGFLIVNMLAVAIYTTNWDCNQVVMPNIRLSDHFDYNYGFGFAVIGYISALLVLCVQCAFTSTKDGEADQPAPSVVKGLIKVVAGVVVGLVLAVVTSMIVLAPNGALEDQGSVYGDKTWSKDGNPCEGQKPYHAGPGDHYFSNTDCFKDQTALTLEQAGANVTKGYKGGLDAGSRVPITEEYEDVGMCAVNVHWHLGSEHLSVGQYDQKGSGPAVNPQRRNSSNAMHNPDHVRKLAAAPVDYGFRCHHYETMTDAQKAPYDWKYCDKSTMVGETYEVHWPHSAAGACGTEWQFQTPFYDGVFCRDGIITIAPLNTYKTVGVQGQVFTIVNDDEHMPPEGFNLMDHAWKDDTHWKDVAKYTGSTTGTTRDNQECSRYTPITWQVDRTCHKVSAKAWDEMCKKMKEQKDDMKDDTHAHGARAFAKKQMVANNQQSRK